MQVLINSMIKIWAFIKRDFLTEVSYRAAFLVQMAGIIFSILVWYFISKIVPPDIAELKGLDYFSWVLIGIAFTSYLNTALNSFARKIRSEQLTGTLEAMLVTPTRTPMVIFSSATWEFIFSSFRVVVYLALGTFLFNVQVHMESLLAFCIVLLLTILSFSGIGILSASFILYFKKGDPINFFITSVMTLFGGVLFPYEKLPPYLMKISYFLPITYSLNAIRDALLKGAPLGKLQNEVLILAIFAIVIVPLSLLAARFAIRKAKEEGSLIQY
ncbi:MAG: ABC transporter permease [Acidobacteriota bacterium]